MWDGGNDPCKLPAPPVSDLQLCDLLNTQQRENPWESGGCLRPHAGSRLWCVHSMIPNWLGRTPGLSWGDPVTQTASGVSEVKWGVWDGPFGAAAGSGMQLYKAKMDLHEGRNSPS